MRGQVDETPATRSDAESGFRRVGSEQDGNVLDLSFGSYELPRFSWVPEIVTVNIEADNDPSKGAGEPAIICMGGVIANAVFDATGARVRQIPLTPERIKAALA